MASTFREVLLFFEQIGIYDVVLPFLLVFTIVFAILEKTKLFGTEGLHRMLHFLEPVYGIDGQTQRYRIEKDRRDARVMTIYEGTNEIQRFLLLKDVIDMVGP